jgi:cysteine-rich repeat protein
MQNGSEACDNGQNLDPAYSPTIPASQTPCTPACTTPRFCGDTILDAADGETCDDGNNTDGDGCSADCHHTERLVFVSSTLFKGDMSSLTMPPLKASVMGVARGDARCQTLATAAGLTGTFKAWLSNTTDAPATRFDTTFTGIYRLTSAGNPIVATGWSGLTTNPLLHPIDADENGKSASGELVWTNTLPDGTPASNLHCSDWSSPLAKDSTTAGDSSQIDATWTNLDSGLCASPYRLYCFEDPT